MIYLDSSALMKLVREEAETAALCDWLDPQPEVPVITGELGRVEVLRAARRASDEVLAEARAVVGDVDLVPLDRAVQDLACELGEPLLRTLDALHLAPAVLLRDELTAVVHVRPPADECGPSRRTAPRLHLARATGTPRSWRRDHRASAALHRLEPRWRRARSRPTWWAGLGAALALA